MLDLSSYNLSFKMIMQHSTKEAVFVAAMFTVIVTKPLTQTKTAG